MVSARVLNPVVLSEFRKMSSSPGVSRQLERIKRNLFGPVHTNLLESKPSFSAELERHQELATQKWGFDFRSDRPLNSNGSYIWERVSTQESTFAPPMYTLTRAAHVRADSNVSSMDLLLDERADRENQSANSSLDSCTDNEYDSQSESLPLVASTSAAALTASTSSKSSSSASSSANTPSCSYSTQEHRKRQLKITEFMKERKRLSQAPKKVSPAKRMRTSSGSNSNSSSSSSFLQFGCPMKRSRHNN